MHGPPGFQMKQSRTSAFDVELRSNTPSRIVRFMATGALPASKHINQFLALIHIAQPFLVHVSLPQTLASSSILRKRADLGGGGDGEGLACPVVDVGEGCGSAIQVCGSNSDLLLPARSGVNCRNEP